ncbi:MAG: VanZ family protein [Candidatus Omnitrophota bacterium]
MPLILPKISFALGAYIVISAAYMQQVRNWLFALFGNAAMEGALQISFAILALLIASYAARKKAGFLRIVFLSALCVLAYLFSSWQPYFSEKIHIVTYGLLGYCAAMEFFGAQRYITWKPIVRALIFAAVISGLDEVFQAALPYRVGDFRDFFTNIMSSVFGVSIFLLHHV